MNLPLFALTLSCLAVGCNSHNILVFLPLPGWSHYVQVQPIFQALAERGHNLTVLSPFPPKKPIKNFNHIYLGLEGWTQMMADWNPTESFKFRHPIELIHVWQDMADIIVPEVFQSAAFRNLFGSKFDLVFLELFFSQEAFVVLGRLFDAPIVTYSSFGYSPQILKLVGATNAFSYLAHKDLPYAGPMNHWQSLDNALMSYLIMLYVDNFYYPVHDYVIAEYIPGRHPPPITELLRNVSLFLLQADTAIDGAKLYPPCVVEIAGLHLKDPTPLDEELQSIMDNAKSGVVYFSYGSVVKMSHLPREMIEAFLTTFERLDQVVLWKTDLDTTDLTIPRNVYVKKWFAQTGILAHPNCKLFVTHGGLSSMMEAVRAGVPVVGTSFYGDQIINLANAEYLGYGLHVHYTNLTQQWLESAIRRIVNDPKYKENALRRSAIFNDKPMPPLENAVYWIEYVIRHKGAHHLKPIAAHIPWDMLFHFDVYHLFLAVILAPICALCMGVFCLVKLFSRKSIKEKTN